MEKLFVYGTLREPEVQKKVIGRVAAGTEDTLDDYGLSEIVIEGEKFPAAIPKIGESIAGQVIKITPEELKLIDDYETEAYKRVKATLKSKIIAWVFEL
ncbi:MAG: hypothetical protein A2941_01760 [Candidatus Yanofskybacteria bacterium RIFCSPLOWO2_01_FULL_49_17]|uniref:Putative gamma-glutamylcyclotransferase n=1 Tax=Candidatus Yanofskybacteria bacterium RIFCSPLOWO2_01_FULL_49_17 TaxID=1802700 RepID=A0A1F8GQP3_9BACT|nr:MAG: hypothetical protein A2941_01760 [Candidatus Yanofskybacteria bacterium RIFCSPLOWO2_01_FULL_49_17]